MTNAGLCGETGSRHLANGWSQSKVLLECRKNYELALPILYIVVTLVNNKILLRTGKTFASVIA
jgi:hypothetical protein